MKAKEARKIIKKMAKGEFYKMYSELIEYSSGRTRLSYRAYIIGYSWTDDLPTWEEVISQLKRFQEGSVV